MSKLLIWAGKNIDGALALALALTVATLGLLNVVNRELIESATLLILALLAEVVMRERWQRGRIEGTIRDGLAETSGELKKLQAPLAEVTSAGQVVTQTRAALDRLSLVRVLSSAEIRDALAAAWRDTDRWYFRGGTGAYLRAVTLPECIRNARQRKSQLQVRLEIVDPTNEVTCQRYAKFKGALMTDDLDVRGERWTLDKTRKELFATILATCWYRQRHSLLDIEVRLSSVMTTFRWDLSSLWIMMTEEDPHAPALLAEKGSFYYDRWNTEFMASLDQARPLPIGADGLALLDDSPTVDQTRRLFDGLGTPLPRSFTDRDVTDIVQRALKPRNPYG